MTQVSVVVDSVWQVSSTFGSARLEVASAMADSTVADSVSDSLESRPFEVSRQMDWGLRVIICVYGVVRQLLRPMIDAWHGRLFSNRAIASSRLSMGGAPVEAARGDARQGNMCRTVTGE